jgi:uncharacterized membrane protein
MDSFRTWMETLGLAVDGFGVLIVVVGASLASIRYLLALLRRRANAYQSFRQSLGRAILLGLEFLIAGDIIRTVAIEPTMESVAVLAGIVAVRTFLSFTLELELHGRWPWARHDKPALEKREDG